MKPYYEDSAVTLWLGDSYELLSEVVPDSEGFALVADPVYGNNYVHGAEKIPHASKFNDMPLVGNDVPFDPAPFLRFNHVILWGANHYGSRLPDSPGWLVWDKRCNTGTNDQSDCELAWTNFLKTARIYYHVWDGFRRGSEKATPRVHPTQKALGLMKWCIRFLPPGIGVVDPFAGSGTTLVAAKDLRRKAIGIEIEERYCEIAAQRLTQEVLELGA